VTPTSTELSSAEYTSGQDQALTSERWWGHTGGHAGHGAVVSVSNVSCSGEDVDCSAEPGDLGDQEHICEVRDVRSHALIFVGSQGFTLTDG